MSIKNTIALILFGVLLTTWIQASSKTVSIKDVELLVEKQQYLSAFQELEAMDPNNENPDIVIQKTDIVLSGFVKSINHKIFGLCDLKPGENLDALRAKAQNVTQKVFMFQADKILNRLLDRDSKNTKLIKALGNYYYEVYLHYGKNGADNQPVLAQSKVYFIQLEQYEPLDSYYLNAIGVAYLSESNFNEAEKYFRKAISFDPKEAKSHYNLAFSLMKGHGNVNEAIEEAKMAYQLYEHPYPKADAARLLGVLYDRIDNLAEARRYTLISSELGF